MRYKSIKFKDFSGGGGKYFHDPKKPNKTDHTWRMEYWAERKWLAIRRQLLATSFAGTASSQKRTSANIGEYYIVAVEDTTIKIKRTYQHGNYSEVKDFGGNSNSPMYACAFGNKYILFYLDVAVKKVAYSTDYGSNFTIATYAGGNVIDHEIIGDTLYLLDEDSNIYKTVDGINYTQYFDGSTLASGHELKQINALENILYAVLSSLGGTQSLLIHFENAEIIFDKLFVSDFAPISIITLADKMQIANISTGELYLYEFNGADLKLFNVFYNIETDLHSPKFLNKDDYFAHLVCSDVDDSDKFRHLIKIGSKQEVFYQTSYTNTYDFANLSVVSGKLYFQLITSTQIKIGRNSGGTFNSSGEIYPPLINKGKITPCHLVLTHRPLVSGESVKIYIDKDFTGSWGSAVLTSSTVGATEKIYSFPAGSNCKFIRFKIELITTDDTKTPEDIQLEFLYKPIGLSVSK